MPVSFDFCHQGHALVTLYVHFYALIGQNLTGEFMRKIYAASWNLFTLTAEANRVLSQHVMFFSTECTKWNSAAIKSLLLFMASLLIGFLVEKYVGSGKSEIRFRNGIVFVFHFAWCVRGLKSLKRFLPYVIVFRSSRMVSLSNFCIWCLFFISNLMKSGVVYAAI